MKRLRHWAAAVCLMLVFPAAASPAPATSPPPMTGYVAWWLGDAWKTTPLEGFERIIFIEQRIDVSGRIAGANGWPEQWQELRDASREAGVGVKTAIPVVTIDAVWRQRPGIAGSMRLVLAAE